MDWLLGSADDVAARIPGGAKIAIGVDRAGVAMATTRALIRRGVRNLHLVCAPMAGLPADLLIGAGCVATLETSAITFGEHGTAHRFHDWPGAGPRRKHRRAACSSTCWAAGGKAS